MTSIGFDRLRTLVLGLILSAVLLAFKPSLLAHQAHQAPPAGQTAPKSCHLSQSDKQRSHGPAIYDVDPDHQWNRLFAKLYVRRSRDGHAYGGDELDPYLWGDTKYLIEGPSHAEAMALLDQFLATHAERLSTDPLKRALLQRDLWAVFDWLKTPYSNKRAAITELQSKLAQVMQRLALTPNQIPTLPDTYAAAVASGSFAAAYDPEHRGRPFLPRDLFSPSGPWVCLGMADHHPPAAAHTAFFGARSIFIVFLSLPEGRAATLAYLEHLRGFPEPMIPVSEDFYRLVSNAGVSRNSAQNRVPNPNLPQFPVGTEVALVRRMAIIDSDGHWVPTGITESVQLRAFTNVPSREDWLSGRVDPSQDAFEFRVDRARLFADQEGGLRAVTDTERDFSVFLTLPFDFLEGTDAKQQLPPDRMQGYVLQQCTHCHQAPGIHSMLAPRTIWGGLAESFSPFVPSSPSEQTAAEGELAVRTESWTKLKRWWK